LAVAVATACAEPPLERSSPVVPLPQEVDGLHLGMSRAELEETRPGARRDDSTGEYFEEMEAAPFLSSAGYRFENDVLVEMRFGRELTLEEAEAELIRLIPGFLDGCRRLWGEPNEIVALSNTYGSDEPYHFPVLYWNRGEVTVEASFTPATAAARAALEPSPGVPRYLSFVVAFSDVAAERRRNMDLTDESELVGNVFPGFPGEGQVQGPILE
jgi:hypothetical protein